MEKTYLLSLLILLVLLLVISEKFQIFAVDKNKITKEKEKIAIVVGGGGMKCAYSAGVLAALAKELKFTEPYVVVGSSGGISLSYYVSGQYDLIEKIWTDLLTNKKFISIARIYPIMDIDYMIDVVFKELAVLEIDNVTNSKIKLFLSATNSKSGKAEYFSNDGKSDLYEVMRATTAVPLIYNKSVSLDGNQYIDGDIGSSINTDIKKAVEEGANKIIIIENIRTIPTNSNGVNNFWKFYSFFASEPIRRAIKNNSKNRIDPQQENIEIFDIQPSEILNIGYIDNSEIDLKEAFKLGYNDVISNSKLKEFLK